MVLKRICTVLVMCSVLFASSLALADQTPTDRVKAGVEELIAMLSDPDMLDPDKHDASVTRLRKTAEKYIDFGLVTKYSIGKPWLKMSSALRADMTEAFIQLMERSYLRRIPAYSGEKVQYTKELISGKKAKVLTEIMNKDKKIVVEFRLRIVHGVWMIYDVVAEGVSLVMNYRSQFSAILQKGTPEDLLQLIHERVEKLDRNEPDELDKEEFAS
ncbi:ABC transporter substrate-binding protein [Pseudodesulfovibrio sp. JC047]|uniref:Tgt2/MlaC family protein n=1 Tax=Pseudodesulfovibrio sp. JC047 TaxID=2683199 RepID=UPI0013D0A448|nr:ABC transporter substrate-binding protein [Pseudodesulfovibrio sp. JC047]NDV19638.1 ABC transporter substrate-binding protein [Pseudodesulfovibrio sp. JC047]